MQRHDRQDCVICFGEGDLLMRSFAFICNSSILVVLTILLSYLVSRAVDFKGFICSGFNRLNDEYNERRLKREVHKYSRVVTVKMHFVEKVELYYIDKSNIRLYLPFMNFYSLVVVLLLIFILIFEPVYRVLYFVPSTLVVCLLFSMIPVFILDLMGRRNSEVIRRKLAEFISVLNRWCAVKEDIIYAFEKSIDSGIGEPLKTYIRDMVIQVNMGIDPLEALDILYLKVDNVQFRDFIINIKQNIKHRGDIRCLLTNLEDQFYKIEEEYNRRKISTYKDRLVIYFAMFAVLFTGYYFLKLNPRVEVFYLGTLEGKMLLTLFCVLYASGLYLSFRITRFKH
jgi:Flp pilus assembly protein TadB